MPFKHHAAHRHRIPKARHRVTNWPAYEAGLRRRGDMTVWLDAASLAGWHAPRRTTPGGQPRCPDLASELVPTLRLVLHLAWGRDEALAGTMLRPPGLALSLPDHTTQCRRARGFAARRPRASRHDGPIHRVLDSTGLQVFGQGEWDAGKHGRGPRRWRKLHLAIDAATGEIAAHVLTGGHADDAAQAPACCGRWRAPSPASSRRRLVGEPVCRAAAAARQHDPPLEVIIPPRASAVPGTQDAEGCTMRDRHGRVMADKGRMGWQRAASGHGRRNHVETTMGRCKHLTGSRLRAHKPPSKARRPSSYHGSTG